MIVIRLAIILWFAGFYKVQPAFLDGSTYKKTIMDGADWSKLIHATIELPVPTTIQCASHCKQLGVGSCNVFVPDPVNQKCYIGLDDGTDYTHLPTQSGSKPVFYDTGTLIAILEENFYVLDSIKDETVWKSHIFEEVALDFSKDVIDCSDLCTNHADGCDLFVYVPGTCYFGRVSHTTGDIDESLPDTNVYLNKTKGEDFWFVSITEFRNNGPGSTWTKHINETINGMESYEECAAICRLEHFEFYVYDVTLNICYLCDTKTDLASPITVTFSTPHKAGVNGRVPGLAEAFIEENFFIRETHSQLYARFIFQVFGFVWDAGSCTIHCYFHATGDCDFVAYDSPRKRCNFGRFSHSNTGAIDGQSNLKAYIVKSATHDVRPDWFQSNLDIKHRVWTQYQSVTQFQVSSEVQCAQNAVISREFSNHAHKEGTFYIMNGTDMCIIGTWHRDASLVIEDNTIDTVHHQRFATNIFRARVYRDYRLTHPYVTRYVSKTVTLTGISEDLDRLHDCVALCTIQWNGEDRFCHFAYIEGDVCHLGHIQADSPFTVVSGLASPVPDNVIRYNRQHTEGFVRQRMDYLLPAGTSHGDFIYKNAGETQHANECGLICIFEFDNNCTFAVHYQKNCLLGDYSVVNPVMTVTFSGTEKMFARLNYVPPSMLEKFETSTGNVAASNGYVSSMWWQLYFEKDEALDLEECATACYLETSVLKKNCHAIYHDDTEGTCYYGRFDKGLDIRGEFPLNNSVSDSTVYYVKKNLVFEKLLENKLKDDDCGARNCSCLNSGFNYLNTTDRLHFTSSEYPGYGVDTNCYWGVLCPDCNQIKLVFTNVDVSEDDGMQVRIGLGHFAPLFYPDPNSNSSLIINTGTHLIDTTFLVMEWFSDSNNSTLADGISGYIDPIM